MQIYICILHLILLTQAKQVPEPSAPSAPSGIPRTNVRSGSRASRRTRPSEKLWRDHSSTNPAGYQSATAPLAYARIAEIAGWITFPMGALRYSQPRSRPGRSAWARNSGIQNSLGRSQVPRPSRSQRSTRLIFFTRRWKSASSALHG